MNVNAWILGFLQPDASGEPLSENVPYAEKEHVETEVFFRRV